jgi:hypothetical protein
MTSIIKYIARSLAILLLITISYRGAAQNLRNRADSPIGTIDRSGMVRDARYNTFCSFESDYSIRDAHHTILGYLQGGRIQDTAHHTLGRIQHNGTVQDGNGNFIGIIQKDGRVEDVNHNHIGNVRLEDVEIERAAVVYFFFKLPR